jgi:hypothetical protein
MLHRVGFNQRRKIFFQDSAIVTLVRIAWLVWQRPVQTFCAMWIAAGTLAACAPSPLEQIPPRLPTAGADVMDDVTNAGRVQSIAVNPTNRDNAIIAMQFGGMWRTFDSGGTWFHVDTLPTVYVTDVEFSADGKTAVATVFRDNQVHNGGGIYVSHTNGDFWSRPVTGAVPMSATTTDPTSAYSISRAPDENGRWYAGTDFGVAVSRDDGATWTHRRVVPHPGPSDRVQSVLAFPRGIVLAMTMNGVHRSDNHGASWRLVISDNFSMSAPSGGNVGNSGNKMSRAPGQPWAFILKEYHFSKQEPRNGSGSLYFYELDTDTKTLLALPQGRSRGPFVSASKDDLNGGNSIRVWVGEGWDGVYVNRASAADFRALLSNAQHDDWVSFIAEAGIHADMGDLGLDGDLKPAFLGSDGGIFKPRPQDNWWNIGGHHKWMSAVVPGSSMNSLQISDMAGTNFHQPDGSIKTSLYFTTQDNRIWGSPDGGVTWPNQDTQEGFGLEVRPDANAGESAQVAYVRIGGSAPPKVFASAGLVNAQGVPDVDQAGNTLDMMQNPYFVAQQGPNPSSWIRWRTPSGAANEVYFSDNSGSSWRKVATVNFASAGEIRSAGTVSWLPVFLGGLTNPVGLVPLSQGSFSADPPPTYDDSDAVRLPGNGSIGRRFTEWDTHAVYGVDPTNWAHVIAPDIIGNDVKYTLDGGKTWTTDAGLTAEVLKGGALKMWGGKPDFMEVTEIAFDPYQSGRILVGTRDAGIICTADNGRTWRTIYDSDKMSYITAFHFHPSGGVYISSYGQGLWYLKTVIGCPKTYSFRWDQPTVEVLENEIPDAREITQPPAARGIALPNNAKLFLSTDESHNGAASLGPDNDLIISGRGFPPGSQIVLRVIEGTFLDRVVSSDQEGHFTVKVQLPPELPYGGFTVEAASSDRSARYSTAQFTKAYSDEEPEEHSRTGQKTR